LSSRDWSAVVPADQLVILVLIIIAVIAAATFRDYGLGWDDYTHSQYGDLLLALYSSGFKDDRALSFVNLYKYGGGFDMLAALASKVLPFGLFETRRLVGAAIGIVGLIATWRIGRRLGGPIAGLIALVLLATCPLYYGHMFINAKDAPFATAMAVLLLGMVRALDEYPQPNSRTVALAGVGAGLAFGSRVLAGIAAPYALAAMLLVICVEAHALGIRSAASRFGQFIWRLLPAFVLGYLIMGLMWPWSILAPLNPMRAAEYFDTFFEKPWRELYAGQLFAVTNMPASYLPRLFVLKLPEVMLVLGFVGAAGALITAAQSRVPLKRRATYVLLVLAALFPVMLAIVAHPALYNGLRHFVFVVPPFAVLGGLGAAWILERVRRLGTLATAAFAAVLICGIALPVSDMVRLHPYQYTTFNWASGGVRMARDNYMLDYWGLAFKQAGEALRTKLADMHLKPPAGRRWTIEICGPQRPAEIALGPEFETTWDRKRADFAMMLGTYYCRDLTARVLVEISREGVDYARVYDIRGRPVPKLLTEPPP
jgi:4-amino-4-deoxy-L-arabinose transferase-like glycosyltransferase